MLEQLKSLMSQQARGQPPEFVYSLTPETRSAILLDLRYVLRDTARAREVPLLLQLVQTVERNNTRIRFPAAVLAKLAREIEKIRDKLPAQSPLISLADGAREHLGAAALENPGLMAHSIPGGGVATRGGAPRASPAGQAPGARAPSQAAAAAMANLSARVAQARAHSNGVNSGFHNSLPKPVPASELAAQGAPAQPGKPAAPAPTPVPEQSLSAVEQARQLKSEASKVEVNYVTTVELGDGALAGYLTYCLSLGEYDKIIETLLARVETQPRVWAWNLLVTAMRLSNHADFSSTAARYHAWLETAHPEAIAEPGAEDQRKFSMEKIAELERKELGEE
jgi:hypothetical protein